MFWYRNLDTIYATPHLNNSIDRKKRAAFPNSLTKGELGNGKEKT